MVPTLDDNIAAIIFNHFSTLCVSLLLPIPTQTCPGCQKRRKVVNIFEKVWFEIENRELFCKNVLNIYIWTNEIEIEKFSYHFNYCISIMLILYLQHAFYIRCYGFYEFLTWKWKQNNRFIIMIWNIVKGQRNTMIILTNNI